MSITSKSPEAVLHFKKGRDLVDNLRAGESTEHFKKAVELDPDFAQATMFLGSVTPGNEGLALIDRAVAMAKDLPEPERQLIESQQAQAQGDNQKAAELLRKVVAAKPRDWRAQLALAQSAFVDENWAELVSASQKVVELSPKSPQAYNNVAYGQAYQGKWDEAIAAAQKQVELLPDEPNPYDTLGEVLLAAGRLDDAQAAFEKAAAKAPKFHLALVGAAEAQMYKGEWNAAYTTLKKAHDAAPRPVDAVGVGLTEMWALAGQGKLAQALKVGAAAERAAEAAQHPASAAFAALNRAAVLAISGKSKDASKLVDGTYAKAKQAELAAPIMRNVMILGEQTRLVAAMKAKKAADADKAYAALEAAISQQNPSRADRSALDWGQGLVAWTKGDAKAAVESMKKCSTLDYTCGFMLVSAQRAAGDAAGASATLARLKGSPRRANDFVYFWSATK